MAATPLKPRPAGPDSLPVPRDLEGKDEFTARFVSHPRMPASVTPHRRRQMAMAAWGAAYLRSQVSVKTSGGEWLLFA